MQHGNNQSDQSFAWFGRGDDSSAQTLSDIGRGIRPGAAVPSTVLVAGVGDGSLLLKGWRDGPSVYLSAADAVPLRRELARAFGSAELAHRHRQGEVR